MAVRKPLVRINGRNRQLPAGDTLASVSQMSSQAITATSNGQTVFTVVGGYAPGNMVVARGGVLTSDFTATNGTSFTYTGSNPVISGEVFTVVKFDAVVLVDGSVVAGIVPVDLVATSNGQTVFAYTHTVGAGFLTVGGSLLSRSAYTDAGTGFTLADGSNIKIGTRLQWVGFPAQTLSNALPIGGTAADSSLLGGQLPAYYALASALPQTRDTGWITTTPTSGSLVPIVFSTPFTGGTPNTFSFMIKAKNANNNFAIGDELVINIGFDHPGVATLYGVQLQDITLSGFNLRIGAAYASLLANKTTAAAFTPVLADWSYRLISRYIP